MAIEENNMTVLTCDECGCTICVQAKDSNNPLLKEFKENHEKCGKEKSFSERLLAVAKFTGWTGNVDQINHRITASYLIVWLANNGMIVEVEKDEIHVYNSGYSDYCTFSCSRITEELLRNSIADLIYDYAAHNKWI